MKRHIKMDIKDFMSDATVAVKAGKWIEVGSYTVGIHEGLIFGYGRGDRVTAEGRYWGVLKDTTATPVEITGDVKFDVHDQQGNVLASAVKQLHTSFMNSDPSILPEKPKFSDMEMFNDDTGIGVGRERIIKMMVRADADATLSKANSQLLVSMTQITT